MSKTLPAIGRPVGDFEGYVLGLEGRVGYVKNRLVFNSQVPGGPLEPIGRVE